jgi:hypothetical protein
VIDENMKFGLKQQLMLPIAEVGGVGRPGYFFFWGKNAIY